MTWVRACSAHEVEEGEGYCLELADRPPVAVWNVDGEFYATADTCTHSQSSLSGDGDLDGDVIVCGLHMANYDVRTGAALELPAEVDLQSFPTRVEQGDVYVEVDER